MGKRDSGLKDMAREWYGRMNRGERGFVFGVQRRPMDKQQQKKNQGR